MDINKYKANVKATESGVWFYLDDDQEVGFLIARIGNKKFRESTARHITPYNQAIARGAVSLAKQDEMLAVVLAESVVLNWKGLERDGKDFPYSKESCEKLLVAPEYQDLVRVVSEFANSAENYRAEEIKESGNESKHTSAGSSPTGRTQQ